MKADDVLAQLKEHYTYEDCFSCNRMDLIEHLKGNMVDSGVRALHDHSGYDEPYEERTLAILFYNDNSRLMITPYMIEACTPTSRI